MSEERKSDLYAKKVGDAVGKKLQPMIQRLDGHDTKLTDHEKRHKKHDKNFKNHDDRLKNIELLIEANKQTSTTTSTSGTNQTLGCSLNGIHMSCQFSEFSCSF